MGKSRGPLEGIRVVDLADEKGELCGRLLSDLGADVLRVEPTGGARSRRLPPFAPDGRTSLYFAVRNAGKRGTHVDWSDPDSRARLEQWLSSADVLVESEAPGALEALDLAPEAVASRHPHLIHTSITDFGHTGPYRDFVGTDMVGFAMGGLMHRAGRIEKPPLCAPGSLAYDAVGITAACATLLAWWKGRRTGRGQHIDVSVMESVANLSDWAIPNYSANPGTPARAGSGIYTLYRCADGWVRMIILVTHHWHALLEWAGHPEELQDPALDQFIQRLMRMDEIVPVFERFFRDQKKIDVAAAAQERGIPATPLLTPGEVLSNPHVAARRTFATLPVGGGLSAEVPSGFLEVDGERAGPRSGPPEPDSDDGADFSGARDLQWVEKVPEASDEYPLRGLRVLDFGTGAVGVEVGRLLAEYGADVVKFETRTAPDFIRAIMGGFMNPNFASSSRSKRSFGVNVKKEEGRDLVLRLAADADVLIENSGTGVMSRLGLGPDDLARVNPRIVTFSSQMPGTRGPWKDWIGYGPNTHPLSGLQYLWNYPEDADSPAGSTNVHPDHLVGRLGATAILAGLIGRLRTGRGRHFEAAQFEVVVNMLGDRLAAESLAPGSVGPLGNRSQRGVPWGCYRCEGEDEWCVINVRSDEEWVSLCDALGRSDWVRDGQLATVDGRRAREDEIDAGVEEWTRTRSNRDVMERLQAAGLPCGAVAHGRFHHEDPHLAARRFLQPVEQPGLGALVFEGPAFRGSDLPDPIVRGAPALGEHTRAIAEEDLGLAADEIDSLVERGVLEDPPE